jgi:hypothetical protein
LTRAFWLLWRQLTVDITVINQTFGPVPCRVDGCEQMLDLGQYLYMQSGQKFSWESEYDGWHHTFLDPGTTSLQAQWVNDPSGGRPVGNVFPVPWPSAGVADGP